MIEAECLRKKKKSKSKYEDTNEVKLRLEMRIVVFRGLEQVEDEVTCFLQLDRVIILGSPRSEGLMEKSPVQTPPVAVWDHDGIERPSKAGAGVDVRQSARCR